MALSLKYKLIVNLKNIPGPVVNKKIVVIECDDYGGIRMPSAKVYRELKNAGVPVPASRYNLYDTLENKDDLEQLFETLQSVRDRKGNSAVMTPFVNLANPDFEKIKASDYQQYFYEPFITTLRRYGRHADTMKVWMQGMEAGIFKPEYHGREHISVQPWLKLLQEGNQQLRIALDHGFAAVEPLQGIHEYAQAFRPEFYFTQEEQKKFLHKSIFEGVKLFEQMFGYTPSAFMPSNSVFHHDFEDTVLQAGIPFLVVAHKNLTPGVDGAPAFTKYTFRQKIQKGKLNFYIRNCAFEPNDDTYSSSDITMRQMAAAFRWHKPAIISTHRVNFAGGISTQNREQGLKELKLLLKKIVKKWPDVEFVSTADMLKQLKNGLLL